MMKGGRAEEKVITGPLFPRLHVNDKEKGGPRAPPRNKMALYEQFSVPSQRFNSSALPLPPHKNTTLVPSSSSGQGVGHERSVFSPFYIPPSAPPHSAENIHSRSSEEMNLNAEKMAFEGKSLKNASYKTTNFTGHFSLTAECSSFRPPNFPNSKNSSAKKFRDGDDFRVPTFVQSGTSCSIKDQNNTDKERQTPSHTAYQGWLTPSAVNSLDEPLKQSNTTDLKSREHGRNQGEQRPKEPVEIKDCTGKSLPHPSTEEKMTEPSKYAKATLSPERLRSSVNEFEHSQNDNMRSYEKSSAGLMPVDSFCDDGISVEPRALSGDEVAENGHASRVRGGESQDKARWSLQLENADKYDDISETSIVEPISGMDISPDDVVGIIGQKYFWKARRAIVSQQRAFAVQVFELHRLIKVQKLIAGSPHLLHVDYSYLRKPPNVPSKPLSVEYRKSQTQAIKQKDDSKKPSQHTECPTENAVGKPLLPSLDDDANKGHSSQFSAYGSYFGNAPTAPIPADTKAGAWCFPPPGNQWLVPIMSPSEGLVYKPFTGPCPPTTGFVAPVYGGCSPLSIPPVSGDFMAPAYGVPATHQQPGIGVMSGAPSVAQNYYSPYGLPVMNPVISACSVEQVNPLAIGRSQKKAGQLSTGELNFNMHSRSSCNISNQKSEAFSCQLKFPTAKDSELQGSTASNPSERVKIGAGHVPDGRDALPLFTVAPATTEGLNRILQSHSSDQQNRVIKVVPHNGRSATESAARIFRSIQEERQQYDSM